MGAGSADWRGSMGDVTTAFEGHPTDADVAIRAATSNDIAALTELRLRFLAEHRQLSTADLPDSFASTTLEYLERQHRAQSAMS